MAAMQLHVLPTNPNLNTMQHGTRNTEHGTHYMQSR